MHWQNAYNILFKYINIIYYDIIRSYSSIQDYPPATMCPLGSIKLSYIAPDTIIEPHTSNLNFRLRQNYLSIKIFL